MIFDFIYVATEEFPEYLVVEREEQIAVYSGLLSTRCILLVLRIRVVYMLILVSDATQSLAILF